MPYMRRNYGTGEKQKIQCTALTGKLWVAAGHVKWTVLLVAAAF